MALNEDAEQAVANLIAKNGMEPELGGSLREVDPDLTGLEPELGGALRQNAVYVDEKLKDYIVDIVFASRRPEDYGIEIQNYIQYGASPRATIFLSMVARAYAFLQGRAYVTPQDIKTIAPNVLRHRILLTYEAEAEDITTDQIIQYLFDSVEVP